MSQSLIVGRFEIFPCSFRKSSELLRVLSSLSVAISAVGDARALKSNPLASVLAALPAVTNSTLPQALALVDGCCKPTLTEGEATIDETLACVAAWYQLSLPKESVNPLIVGVRSLVDALIESSRQTSNSPANSSNSSTADSALSISSSADATDGPTAA